MNKKYYKFGLRPIFSEQASNSIVRFFAFQWDTGGFKEDMTYLLKIYHVFLQNQKLTKEAFEQYVEELKKEKGL